MPLEKPCSEKSNSIHIIDLLLAFFFWLDSGHYFIIHVKEEEKRFWYGGRKMRNNF